MDDLLLDTDEAWRLLRIRKSKGWQLLASGDLESVRIGRRRLIPAQALRDFVERLRKEAKRSP